MKKKEQEIKQNEEGLESTVTRTMKEEIDNKKKVKSEEVRFKEADEIYE